MANTTALIKEFILNHCHLPDGMPLDDDTSFLETDLLDFFQLQLISFLGAAYGIAVNFEEMIPENLDSVSKLAKFVSRKLVDSRTTPE